MIPDLSQDFLRLKPAFDILAAPINRRLVAAGHPSIDVSLLGERAEALPLMPPGRVSANGSCHLIRAKDDWIAINLPRASDLDLLPAWTETDLTVPGGGDQLNAIIATQSAAHWIERGILLGLAVTRPGEAAGVAACRVTRLSRPVPPKPRPRVIDLSSLWAGPLCGHLLHCLGAEVIKVEGRTRPDGARQGSPSLFARLNEGKQMIALDFSDPADRARLKDLILSADVVIEASRPRALRQFGLDAETVMPDRPGLTWVSITAHGCRDEAGDRIGYGDDAAIAGGLIGQDLTGGPRFMADAVADPLTGVHAAGQALEAMEQGGGCILDIALSGVAAEASRTLSQALAA